MLIDLNEYPASGNTSGYDVCVCGAGPAGITLAVKLGLAGKRVALLEAGGLELSQESQDIYQGENLGMQYWGFQACRLRYLGGASNHWAGRSKPFDEVDFMQREFFDLPGWPIKKTELDKYLQEAKEVLDIKTDFIAPEIPDWESDLFVSDSFAKSPTRFGEKYREILTASNNIDLFINANLTDIKLNPDLTDVTEITVKNYKNDAYQFSGKTIALAMGGIENARLLLNCDGQMKNGIGNGTDFVGRCFMEHYNINLGYFAGNKKYWEVGKSIGLYTTAKFSLENKIGNSNISFGLPASPKVGGGRSRKVRRFFRDNVCKSDNLTKFSRKFKDFACPGDGTIGTLIEQSPNRNSRIILNNERDYFGSRQANLSWMMNDLDKRTIRITAIEAAKEFARLDYGRVKLADYILDENEDIPPGGPHCHHMGTTRMSSMDKFGVVDENCKVFGINNLYIAGSSVFSTGGGANPTFTIIQLVLRLSDHLTNT